MSSIMGPHKLTDLSSISYKPKFIPSIISAGRVALFKHVGCKIISSAFSSKSLLQIFLVFLDGLSTSTNNLRFLPFNLLRVVISGLGLVTEAGTARGWMGGWVSFVQNPPFSFSSSYVLAPLNILLRF